MTTQHTSLVKALQMKPASQKRNGRFIYSAELNASSKMSQGACGGGGCAGGSCSNGFFK